MKIISFIIQNAMNTCKIAVYKTCASCKMGFCDNKWCGELMCQRCLDICWILDDSVLCDILFTCCDYHRPQINSNNITSISYNNENTMDDIQIEDIYVKNNHTSSPTLLPSELFQSLPTTNPFHHDNFNNNSLTQSRPIAIPKKNEEKGKFDNNPFSQSVPQINEDKEPFVKSKSFIIAKSYEIKDDISSTFKKYIVDKIKNKDN